MPKPWNPADVTPDQIQVICKAVTLVDYHSFFARCGAEFVKLQETCHLNLKASQSVGSVELYYMEFLLGTTLLGGFVFGVVPLDTLSLWDECGPDDAETLPAPWVHLAATHHTYAIRLLSFLPYRFAFDAAAVQAIIRKLKQELKRQGRWFATERFSQLLAQELAVADYK